jgi:isopentenyl-diphosphate Delta-isomerase
MIEHVVLVTPNDEPIGTMEKLAAHQQANLHRAFSVFLFNNKKQMLLQQRAFQKYHSGGLWTNACCSHPFPDEDVANAAVRRLNEELGITTKLQKAFSFTYQAAFDNGLIEYEFDHVFVGFFDDEIFPNSLEVANTCYKTLEEIESDLQQVPHHYTKWFEIAMPKLQQWIKENNYL